MSVQINMNASAIGGTLQLPFSGIVQVPANGIVTVDSRDVTLLLRQGATYAGGTTRFGQSLAPIAGAAAQLVTSTNFANGTLSIANQPDVPRPAFVRIWPGTVAVTGGQVVVNYTANDGTTQSDTISGVSGVTVPVSTNLSKGVVHLNSAIVTGVAGGASPGIQIGTLNQLSAMVDAGFANFSLLSLQVDGAANGNVTVTPSNASFQPSTAPNGTHNYGFNYSFN